MKPAAEEALPEGEAKVTAVREMFDAIAPRYDLVNRVMTFRMDVGWRRKTVAALALGPGARVADLACGTGDLCRELAGAGYAPIGVDLSHGMLRAAHTAAPLALADVLRLPVSDGAVDGATCGFALRNLVDLGTFFAELARAVRPGGRIALLEVAEPPNRLLRAGHRVYFGSVVPRIGGLLSDAAAYRYLPRSVAYLPEPAALVGMLRDAGFADAERTLLSRGIAQLLAATPGPMTVRAVTRRVDGRRDLLGESGEDGIVFERLGSGLAGRGVAAHVPVEELPAFLADIDADDEVGHAGCGPVAFAALPFRPADDLPVAVVPRVVVGSEPDGTAWVTTIGDDAGNEADDADELPVAQTPPPEPSRFTVAATRPVAEWCDAVAAATKHIAAGRLDKVVLAREITVTADRPIARLPLLQRLRRAYGGCFVFAVEGFVGASPELLVERRGDIVRAHPMAGTVPRTGDPTADARLVAGLLASPKLREEHQITIDMVHDTLLPWCSYLDDEAEPSVVAVANVAHLATMVEGRLSSPPPSVLELVGALHPTPAVCGAQRVEALAVIDELEPQDRGRYAGTVGWVDAAGNGTWAVSIRCAQLDGATARLWAGGGIVADSDPATELAETQAKFQALLAAIIRV